MASLSGFQAQFKTPADKAIAIQSGAPSNADFSQVGSVRTVSRNFAAAAIDITTQSSSENRELLDGRGIKTFDVSVGGVADDAQIYKDLLADLLANNLRWFQIDQVDASVKYTFKGKIVSLNQDASHDDAVAFTLEVQSSGSVTIS